MVDETLVSELLRVLRAYDAERDAAKQDAKEHKERMDKLMDEAQDIRAKLEGTSQPSLFGDGDDEDEPAEEPTRGTGLDDAPPSTEAPASDPPSAGGIDAYEQGAQARRDGKAESDCPFEPGSYHGVSWLNGWRELEEIPEGAEDAGS